MRRDQGPMADGPPGGALCGRFSAGRARRGRHTPERARRRRPSIARLLDLVGRLTEHGRQPGERLGKVQRVPDPIDEAAETPRMAGDGAATNPAEPDSHGPSPAMT